MRKLKTLLILLLTFGLAALLSTTALADDATSGTCGTNLTWTLNTDTGVLTISGEGEMSDYAAAGTPWYAYRYSITTVVIEDGVTSISNNAFYWCVNLTSVTIPNSVTSIEGNRVFYNCGSLAEILVSAENTSYTVENGVLFDKDKANLIHYPAGKAETTYEIPDGVVSIETYAFQNCVNLTSVTIPSSVTSIGDYPFRDCSSLTEILVSAGNTAYSTEGGVLFNGDKTKLVCYPAQKAETAYEIPDGVASIETYAFYNCSNLTNVVIPESVTSIRSSAFSDCSSLTSIAIPSSVSFISNSVFAACDSLTEIPVSGENTAYSAEDGVLFNKDKTMLVCYPSGKTTSIYKIPDSVTSIYTDAFRSCDNLTSVTMGDNVTTIGSNAFYDCSNLTNVTIPDSVTTIGNGAFYLCYSLTNVTIGCNVTTIGRSVFFDCSSLTNVTIPASVTSIDNYAFSGCYSLTSVTISNSTVYIDSSAFGWCSSLTDVYYSGSEAEWNEIEIGSNNDYLTSATIHYNSTGPEDADDTGDADTSGSSSGSDESTSGDLNGDGEVDASDLTVLARHVGKVETMEDEIALANADVTGDGNVDASDLTRLAQYVGKIISALD